MKKFIAIASMLLALLIAPTLDAQTHHVPTTDESPIVWTGISVWDQGNLQLSSPYSACPSGQFVNYIDELFEPHCATPPTASTTFTHTITGPATTLVVSSATSAFIDQNNLLLAANATSITLPSSAAIADAEILKLNVSQPLSGSAFTVAAGSAGSVLTPGAGTTLANSVPGGCPTIGTNVNPVTPSQLLMTIEYKASISQYTILSCQLANTAQVAATEFPITVTGLFGTLALNAPIASIVVQHSGTFVNLTISNINGGTCTTPPHFNVFDGFTIGTAPATAIAAAQVFGNVTQVGQTLAVNAGDTVGIFISSAGSGCTGTYFSVTAEIGQP